MSYRDEVNEVLSYKSVQLRTVQQVARDAFTIIMDKIDEIEAGQVVLRDERLPPTNTLNEK